VLLGETASPKRGGDVNGEERNYGMAHGIGIIGLGIMGERMLRTMRKHPNFAVAAAWDPDATAAARLAAVDGRARLPAMPAMSPATTRSTASTSPRRRPLISPTPISPSITARPCLRRSRSPSISRRAAPLRRGGRSQSARPPPAATHRIQTADRAGQGVRPRHRSSAKIRGNAAEALVQRAAQTRKNRTAGFPMLAQEGLPGCGNCAWILLQTATAGRAALMAPYALSFSCDWASLENALKVRKRS
jgi:hypothetical protein